MEKSPDAFRTISEVAEWLDIPTHVLRFWESRFSQIKPVKRAGGRRYYRPSDMRLIGGVKVLLHDQGMTIRSVQKKLREDGIKKVSTFSPPLDGEGIEDMGDVIEATVVEAVEVEPAAPAPAARGTHAATPEPVEEPASEPVAAVADAPDDEPIDLMADDDEEPFDATLPGLDIEQPVEPAPEVPEAEPAQEPEPQPPAPEPAPEPDTSEAPVMFRRSASRITPMPEQDSVPSDNEVAPAAKAAPVQEQVPEPEPVPELPKIPATPGVPTTDPDDDDPAYAAEPSIAARLIVMPPEQLAAHAETLAAAKARLTELRDRLS